MPNLSNFILPVLEDGQIVLRQFSLSGGSGSSVSVEPTLTSGTKVATITVDGTDYDLYCNDYQDATQSAHGLMSSTDKQKLDTLSSVPAGQYHLTFGKTSTTSS